VRMLGKGDDRPINRAEDRMALLAALESVDWVVRFEEKTPIDLIAALRPDILVKGGDYDMEALPESVLVRGWGGRALAIPFEHERSTTALLRKVRAHGA
jgi:D-glycero-beta-D-manno-heptose 1-phosphate adenylyltransferase